jgi:hypothetical protein
MIKSFLQSEIDDFFRILIKNDIAKVIKKSHHQVFTDLAQNPAPFFYNYFSCLKRKKLRILAIDGSADKVSRTKNVAIILRHGIRQK